MVKMLVAAGVGVMRHSLNNEIYEQAVHWIRLSTGVVCDHFSRQMWCAFATDAEKANHFTVTIQRPPLSSMA
jgi:hypothetical protein